MDILSRISAVDVYPNFRGVDTRNNITSHLYAGFRRKSMKIFIDEQEIGRGEEIWPALSKGIEGSHISVIIFLEYASSTWCLKELLEILECKRKNGQIVIPNGQIVNPVFYLVDPSDVQNQTGCIGAAFVKHERWFEEHPEMVQKWREALTDASRLPGFRSTITRR